ncbi:MAG: acyltransferase [Chitinophagales bacterium]
MTDAVHRSNNNFDFIRFLAASFVIITHSQALLGHGGNDWLSSISRGTMQFSHLGVAIFFTISGYLIAQSLIRSKTYSGYLWKRFLRIFPGLAVVLLLLILLLGPVVGSLPLKEYFSSGQTWGVLLTLSLYKLNIVLPGVFSTNPMTNVINGSLWTLAYEFSFYLLLLVAGITGLIKNRYVVLLGWVVLFAARTYLRSKIFVYDYATPYLLGLNVMYVVEWSLFFGAGTLLYLFREEIKFNVFIFVAAVAVTIAAVYFNETAGRIVYYLTLPYIIFYLSFLPGALNHFGKYGDFSYGIYIYAYPVQQTLVYFLGPDTGVALLAAVSFACTLPLAIASWYLVEKKALAFKNAVN